MTLIVFGVLVTFQVDEMGANQATPWMGIEERVNIYAMMLWLALLAIGLLRAEEPSAPRPIGTPEVTPQGAQGIPG